MSNIQDAIRRAAKLLELATHPNTSVEEAATAAAQAQAIMTKYQIEALVAQADVDSLSPETEEEIFDFGKKGAHIEDSGDKRIAGWKWPLIDAISLVNGCEAYFGHARHRASHLVGSATGYTKTIDVIGRPSDVTAVRYLYGFLSREVDRLTERDGKGCGRVWCSNFRLGIVDTITRKLHEQRKATVAQLRAEAESRTAIDQSRALVRIDNAIARIEERRIELRDWMKKNTRLRAGSGGTGPEYNPDAWAQGRRAGESVEIRNRAKGALDSG